MGVFSRIKETFSQKDEPSLQKTPSFAELLEVSFNIVGDYGTALESPNPEDGIGAYCSEKRLPFKKEAIKGALDMQQKILSDPKLRELVAKTLSKERSDYFLSAYYADILKASQTTLEWFVPEDDLRLKEQRDLALASAQLLDGLQPEQTSKFLDDPYMGKILEAARDCKP